MRVYTVCREKERGGESKGKETRRETETHIYRCSFRASENPGRKHVQYNDASEILGGARTRDELNTLLLAAVLRVIAPLRDTRQ